jgi:hypothetical protein
MARAVEFQKLSSLQIEQIVDKIVPLIAAPEDHEFFHAVLSLKLEDCQSSGQAAYFVSRLLQSAAEPKVKP